MLLSQYLKKQGRGSLSFIAKSASTHAPDVSRWAKGTRPVPIEKCVLIELATDGQVTRKDLRPSDWHLIWPELVESA